METNFQEESGSFQTAVWKRRVPCSCLQNNNGSGNSNSTSKTNLMSPTPACTLFKEVEVQPLEPGGNYVKSSGRALSFQRLASSLLPCTMASDGWSSLFHWCSWCSSPTRLRMAIRKSRSSSRGGGADRVTHDPPWSCHGRSEISQNHGGASEVA